MADEKKVSVVLAAYNAAEYIDEAINSILEQTFRNFELILINDGSTDNTLSILEKYAQLDERVLVRSQENAGPASARNLGLLMAKGRWIAILDADDIALPERLERQLAFAEANPDTVLLGSGCVEVNANGTPIKEHNYPSRHADLIMKMERRQSFPPHSSCLYHAETVRQVGGFNTRLVPSEDVDLWLRLAEVGRIACLPIPLIKLRKHSTGISHHDSGITQQVMGTAARICHFLRLQDFSDPSKANIQAWTHFITWVRHKLERAKIVEQTAYWASIRKEWYAEDNRNSLLKRLRLVNDVAFSRYGITLLRAKLFGSDVAKSLAHEWIESYANLPQK